MTLGHRVSKLLYPINIPPPIASSPAYF